MPRSTQNGAAFTLVLAVCLLAAPGGARPASTSATASPALDGVDYHAEIEPLLSRYCHRCHGERRQRADVRLDVLNPDMVSGPDADHWHAALDMINAGKMPPDDQEQMTDAERRLVVGWLTDSLERAAVARRGERRIVMRRLTRAQYTNTLQDLLGLGVEFGHPLPPDALSEMGFSNAGEVLRSSPLHLEYYQAIARRALDRAIAVGERPPITRYRVRFGTGIGRGRVAGETGGYQSVPMSPDDFVVEILDGAGRPRLGRDEEERAALDATRRRISVGLRGSSHDRFRVVDEGVILYSALPHVEQVPKTWQGPSPNLKLEMQRVFPETGDLVVRVRASRGYRPPLQEQVLVALDEPRPLVSLGDDLDVITRDEALVLRAGDTGERTNLVLEGDTLRPVDVPMASHAAFWPSIPRDGVYQVDLVHPSADPEAMASVRLNVNGLKLDLRPRLDEEQRRLGRAVTPLGAVNLRRGRCELSLGGPFFIGMSHVVLTRLEDEHPLVRRLTTEADAEELAGLEDLTPAIRVFAGTRTDDGMDYAEFDEAREVRAPLGAPQSYAFRTSLENLPIPEPESGDTEILSGFMLIGLWNDHLVKSPAESGPPLLVESIEVEAPHYSAWPPASHRAIFFDSPHAADPVAYTREVVSRFAERAFRRPLEQAELDRYMAFWQELRGDYAVYEHGVREVLVAVLCSPSFLHLAEPRDSLSADGKLPERALASRLSYFLWNSPPDETLLELAREERLRAQLAAQVDRMLDDPRAERFVRAWGREWLRVDRLESMAVDAAAHPTFTRFVKRDMALETYSFLYEVLRRDLSLFTLIDSSFAMLNQNLAEFYGIGGVAGGHFRPVPVAKELGRGGLLSQGAFLTGHSDGRQSHPVKRAVWLKEKILGDPPPPPPPNVPDLDPEAPGFEHLTLKEQLEVHRDKPSCADCHAGIDPYGIVFEGYDGVGLRVQERNGKPVDSRSTLPDGTELEGVDELKAWILESASQSFATSLIEHLYAYALGRDLDYSDEAEIERILGEVESSDHRIRSVIQGIVSSPAFAES